MNRVKRGTQKSLQVEWIPDYMGKCYNCPKVQLGYYLVAFGVSKETPSGYCQVKLCKRCLTALKKRLEAI